MKRKHFVKLFLMSLVMTLVSCQSDLLPFKDLKENDFTLETTKGEIESFSLLAPLNNSSSIEIPTFTWEKAVNATNYTLEIASSVTFETGSDLIPLLDSELYLKKQGIATTSFTLSSSIRIKDRSYYWRVTAFNETNSKKCLEEYGTFYLAANTYEEIPIEIGDAENWLVHSHGSKADVSINNTNFFGNNKEALAIEFTMEQTKTGNIESDGWIVITKSAEMELYGTDSLYFNFYYMGHDANIFVRFLDSDNEYWHCEIQIARDSKQAVILEFDDFVLRTKDSYVGDGVFGYHNIKYFEIVFERSFGDGVCLMSDIKAIRHERYSHMFVNELNFLDYERSSWINEAYDFNGQVSDEGKTLTLQYDSQANAYNEKGIGSSGYGFTKFPINKYFTKGDAIKVDVKYTGYALSSMLLRVYEQDKDRWVYTEPFENLIEGEFKTLIIPFGSFSKSQVVGDGVRQFYYILNLQFGLNKAYGTGTLSFRNFKIVSLSNEFSNEERIKNVGMDGVIENFDQYTSSNELLYSWFLTDTNKDEFMELEKEKKAGGSSNRAAGKVYYKSDMGIAAYSVATNVTTSNANALSIWIKDGSVKAENAAFNYLDNVTPEMIIQLRLKTGEEYRYTLPSVSNIWTEHTIPYSLFTINNPEIFFEGPGPLVSEEIAYFSIGMHYSYFLEDGRPYPMYSSDNPVYLDNIRLTTSTSYSESIKEIIYSPSEDDPKICYIDDFESYANVDELLVNWGDAVNFDYSEMSLSNDTAGQIDNYQSLKLQYEGKATSVNYFLATSFASSVEARGMEISLKGDNKATLYINIYLETSGSILQFRYTLTNFGNVWKKYTIGFENFINLAGGNKNIVVGDVQFIQKITFGITNNADDERSHIYVDDLVFNGKISYTALSVINL